MKGHFDWAADGHFRAGEDGSTAFYLGRRGYLVRSEEQRQALHAAVKRGYQVGAWSLLFLLLAGAIVIAKLAPGYRPLVWLSWLPQALLLVAWWRWDVTPLTEGMAAAPARPYRTLRQRFARYAETYSYIRLSALLCLSVAAGVWAFLFEDTAYSPALARVGVVIGLGWAILGSAALILAKLRREAP